MTIADIYATYNVMPILQDHMIRVAYVARTISEHTTEPTNTEEIMHACLLHDLGNIAKFNLEVVPEAIEPEGLEYWQKIQNDFIEKYGADEVEATHTICQEIGVPDTIMRLVNAFGTRNVITLTQNQDLEKMIVNYADHRVSPYGIDTLRNRINDQNERIRASLTPEQAENKIAKRKESNEAKFELERLIFEKTDIKPEDITDVAVNEIMDEYLDASPF